MEKKRLGFLAFSEPRDEMFVRHAARTEIAYKEGMELLQKRGIEVISGDGLIRSTEDALKQAKYLLTQNVEGVLIYLLGWTYPKFIVLATRILDLPCAVLAENAASTFFAVSGSLAQVGRYHKRIVGSIKDKGVMRKVMAFARASTTVARLKGQTYGYFGGRALGMYTVMGDLAQIHKLFGVDIEHIDQLEIVREAEKLPEERVEKFMKWLEENIGAILYDGILVTREKIKLQLRGYLATKDLVQKNAFDFCGVKCQPELSDKWVNQCLTPTFMPDPIDAEGPKKPINCACEVDHDGALSMQILTLVSGGLPSMLMDLMVDAPNNRAKAFNCGGQCSWYAARSENPTENLQKIQLRPHVQGKAGGAALNYIVAPGTYTLARLTRRNLKYRMHILCCDFVVPKEPWPRRWSAGAYMDWGSIDCERFIQEFDANHIHCVVGDYVEELVDFCQMIGIDYERY
jgi:L-fucose isomerase